VQPLSINSGTESVKKHFRTPFPELPNIYLSRAIKPVSEIFEQKLYIAMKGKGEAQQSY
jgi:hypothetical protein